VVARKKCLKWGGYGVSEDVKKMWSSCTAKFGNFREDANLCLFFESRNESIEQIVPQSCAYRWDENVETDSLS